MKNKTDVIVVGGGPAGISAAVTIARAGKSVILIERGNFSGSKNMFGGAIYVQPTKEIFPNFEQSAPIERKTVIHKYLMLTKDDAVGISYFDKKSEVNSYSVIRAKFDRWMAQEAQKEGVVLVTETVVKDLLIEENKVVGVITELEEYYSDIVILADGVNSLLAKKLGLRKEIKPKDVALGVKEVIKLSKEKIEERFNLEDGEGSIYEIFGEPMLGMLGLGYVYTNKESVSIGLGVGLDELAKRNLKPYELLDQLKSHPRLEPLLKDGELVEYSAHLIPEGGFNKIPKLFSDGVMIAGDGAMLVNNLHWEGTNLAMISGKLAGETAIEALTKGDFSANMLALYQKKLENSFILKDLKSYKNLMNIIHDRAESFLGYYPEKIASFFKMFTTVDSIPKRDKYRSFIKSIFTDRSISELFKDFVNIVKLMLGVLK
ncbi:MAG TPA: FAD-dependent oxidoreductase [Candidatus Gastranaerophilaceae bacterium]|nr:FAD-dependent oxidoreductase [Candidatus Gastranaerophilaceae bacterium]HPT41897.1 FAD-dependent oxidoreductase [Candidatus Gastranaerophilaceae bacterium]